MKYLTELFSNIYFLCAASFAIALLMSFRLYPIIIYVVNKKGLMDEPEARKAHTQSVPTLGGIGLFISFSITISLLAVVVGLSGSNLVKLVSLMPAIILLLIMGVKDDLVLMSPKKKAIGQVVAACIVIFLTDTRITSFGGLLGVNELPYWVSVLFTFFVFVLVINALNLIDGIDGLAGAITIIASATFGFYFLLAEDYLMVLVSFTLIGAIIGYLYYNLSNTRKLFMGDSGSLLLGFLLVYQAIGFLSVSTDPLAPYAVSNAPIILLAVLSYPLLDTLRVFVIRVYQKRSPFSPDRNHIHHGLLRLGLNHKRASLLVALITVLNIELAFLISGLYINLQLYILIIACPLTCLLPLVLIGSLNNRKALEKQWEMYGFFNDVTVQQSPMQVSGSGEVIYEGKQDNISKISPDYPLSGTRRDKGRIRSKGPDHKIKEPVGNEWG